MVSPAVYPATPAARDRFILDRRPTRPLRDPWRHQGVLVEDERSADGRVLSAATVFLTGRECPWRCVMCDLWQYTTVSPTPPGAIAAQVDQALRGVASHRQDGTVFGAPADAEGQPGVQPPAMTHVDLIKLYNAGSFFDPRAVPLEDSVPVASLLGHVERVVVESHPSLIGERVWRFRDACARASNHARGTALEVAMGLETAHPEALERLHKGVTLDQFAAASERLVAEGVDVRVFLLVGVPFVPHDEQRAWLLRSVRIAFDCGASVVSLIPTRSGNGAMEGLEAQGAFIPPSLDDLERALDASLAVAAGRVCADTWDVGRLSACRECLQPRHDRLVAMNLTQSILPRVTCQPCVTKRGAA